MKKIFRIFGLAGFLLMVLSISSSVYAVTAEEAYEAGSAYYKQGLNDECIAQEKAAIALNPNFWPAYQVMGYAYFKEGNKQAAFEAYRESLRINPNNPTLQTVVDQETQYVAALPAAPSNVMSNSSPPNNSSVPVNVNVESEPLGQTNGMPGYPSTNSSFVPPVVTAEPKQNSIYLNVGGASPYSPNDFTLGWTSGLSLGAGFGFNVTKQTSIIISLQYSSFPLNLAAPGYTLTGGDFHTITALLNGKFILVNADNPVLLYLIGGVGAAQFTSDSLMLRSNTTGITATVPGTQLTEADFAIRFGIGIDIKLSQDFYLTFESDGYDTFVSHAVDTSALTNDVFAVGIRLDK